MKIMSMNNQNSQRVQPVQKQPNFGVLDIHYVEISERLGDVVVQQVKELEPQLEEIAKNVNKLVVQPFKCFEDDGYDSLKVFVENESLTPEEQLTLKRNNIWWKDVKEILISMAERAISEFTELKSAKTTK